jgi:hypothetical protein
MRRIWHAKLRWLEEPKSNPPTFFTSNHTTCGDSKPPFLSMKILSVRWLIDLSM